MFYPQSNFYPQSFNPQGFGQQGFNPLATTGQTSFANTLYGIPQPSLHSQQSPVYSQLSPPFGQGQSQYPTQYPNWQQAQQQLAALQQHALQQLLAHQLAAPQIGPQNPSGAGAMSGISNGATGPGPQQQGHQQQPQQHLLQQLAQYHYLIAQQLSQIAAQQASQSAGNPYAGQFIPGQLGSNYQPASTYLPGGTMH
jgi:hypothetical protein